MRPVDFWAMTPSEVWWALQGATARRREEWEKLAWQTARILSPFLKRPVTPEQLLGRGWTPSGGKKKREIEVIDPVAKKEELWRRHLQRLEERQG